MIVEFIYNFGQKVYVGPDTLKKVGTIEAISKHRDIGHRYMVLFYNSDDKRVQAWYSEYELGPVHDDVETKPEPSETKTP